jgi:hypothetical protein
MVPEVGSDFYGQMDAVKQPDPLTLEGNVDHNWRTFKQRFELYAFFGYQDQRE